MSYGKDRRGKERGLLNLIPVRKPGLTKGSGEGHLVDEMTLVRPVREAANEAAGVRRWMRQMFEQRRRFATVAAAALALGVGYHVVFGQNGLIAFDKKKQDARALARQLDELQQDNDALQGHVDRLQHDPGAIEHQAREELHYTRPGEVIVTLPNEPAKR